MMALLLASGINLAIPEFIRRFLNSDDSLEIITRQPLTIGGALIGIFLLQAVAFYLRTYWFGRVGHAVVFDLRERLYSSLLRKPLQFFDQQRTGDLISRINADTLMLQDVVSIRLSVLIRYLLQVIIGIILMVFLSPYLTLLIAMILPIIILLSRSLGKRLRSLSKQQQTKLGEATTSAEESIGGIRTVKAFTGERFEMNRFLSQISLVRDLGFARAQFAAFFASSINFLMNGALVVIFLLGIRAVTLGNLSTGDLTAFLLYGAIVAISFAFLAGSIGELYQATGAAERIFETLMAAEESTISTTDESATPIERLTYKHVSFSYPTRTDIRALNDISFSAAKGEFIAFVGPSGAGKSTIMNLLLRFYELQEGAIYYDDINIATKPIQETRSRIGLVPQDPLLFADTIESNLKYGAEGISQEELEAVCEQVAILEFIRSLPDGFRTYVGERGVQLSGGQKQRLAIARALLRKPDILLLDEATSSLDSESEAIIKNAISKIKHGCILIAIAHRLSTVQQADRIYVLHHGEIIEKGNHQELIALNGMYHELVAYQALVT
jgi:ATP-binding cassette subfamily B protein